MQQLEVRTNDHEELKDITSVINSEIPSGFSGVVTIYTPHTTAALCINEGADPDVKTDVLSTLSNLIPWGDKYKHLEGNSAAHIKAILVGNSIQVIVENGKCRLGTWEKIFLCEFDGPRTRKVWLSLISEVD